MNKPIFTTRTMVLLVAGLVAAALLLGCAPKNVLTQGTVIEKSYDDPDDWSTLYCAAQGKYGCTLWLPQDHHDGPHWSLRVVGRDDKGKEHKEWHEVTEVFYGEIVMGDVVNFPNMRRVPQ